jgi:EAL domain-containing protein (putative c-di-GMP-specific phosphodiesterase class I)/GGDEF domain-containing protein
MKAAQGLRLGAADVVSGADAEQLVLVFRRELEHVTRTRRVNQLHHALQEAEQRCELLLRSSESAIAYVHEGMHIHANATYLRLFGFDDPDDVLGLPLIDLLTDESGEALRGELRRFRQHDGEQHIDFAGRSRDGSLVSGRMTLATAQYEGEPCIQVTVRTQSGPAASGSQASGPALLCPEVWEASADAGAEGADESSFVVNGTAAPAAETANGRAQSSVSDFLEAAGRLGAAPEPCIAILVVQIDQFTQLQTEQGLRNAERIGAEIHRTLESNLAGNPVFRLTAHQFAIFTMHEDRASARALCEHLQNRIRATSITIQAGRVSARVSIGAALLETRGEAPDATHLEAVLDLAFAATARAAEAGGDRFELVGSQIDADPDETPAGRLIAEINRAIDEEAFALLFQPIISLRGDASEHYEVFLRMVGKDGSHVRPDGFLNTAIEHGVAGKIDRWVILRAIKALMAHRIAGHDTRLTINVTSNSIADPEFAPWLGVALRAARLPSDAVIFQLAEQDVASMVRQAQAFVQTLRAMHCQASLSRFGVTDAALERLKQIPVDYVKLDGRLIESMNADPAERECVIQLLSQLQSLGKMSVVPMVETANMLSVLWQAGANFVQGHYLQPPGPDMDFDFSTAD